MDPLAKYGLDPRYCAIKPGTTTLAMLSPDACPNGHPLRPPNVTISTTNTRHPDPRRSAGLVVHRWHCWTCGADWSSAPIPGATHWPGVPVGDDEAT